MDKRLGILRRTTLAALASWSVGVRTGVGAAAPSAEARQAASLARAEFLDAQGSVHRLVELTRPLLLFNLWAAWCPGCLSELPTIRTFATRLGPDTIDVVMLSHGMNWSGDVAYVRRTGLPFRHWRLTPSASDLIAASVFRIEDDRFGLPQSLLLAGRERVLVQSHQGALDWSSPDCLRLARSWLARAG
jgi:thiol-disulfide isomerase/thioredoxin